MSLTNGESQRFTGDGVPNTVSSIPLTDVDARTPGEATIGALVKDATAQVSTLVRAEVELAKAEVTGEVKKGLQGSVFFILAFTVLLFSSFFFFFLPGRDARHLGAALAGVPHRLPDHGGDHRDSGAARLSARAQAEAPEKTIESLKQAKNVIPGSHDDAKPSVDFNARR